MSGVREAEARAQAAEQALQAAQADLTQRRAALDQAQVAARTRPALPVVMLGALIQVLVGRPVAAERRADAAERQTTASDCAALPLLATHLSFVEVEPPASADRRRRLADSCS